MPTDTETSEERGIHPKGFRLPARTRLGRVRLQVADLDRSLVFYQTVLGFRILRRSDATVTLGPHDDQHEIVELHALSLKAAGYEAKLDADGLHTTDPWGIHLRLITTGGIK